MRTALLAALAVSALAVTACDSGGGGTTTTASTAPAAAPPAPPPPPPPPAPTVLPGLSAPYATEADWVAACVAEGKIDKTVCECAGKAIMADQGDKALFQWAWEAYIVRTGMGAVRAKKWFTDNGMDTAAEQKFANAIGKCFVTQ